MRIVLALIILLLIAPFQQAVRADETYEKLVQRIDRSLQRAERFLMNAQSKDGAWRSQVYGALRDGVALTPHVVSGLCGMRGVEASSPESLKRSANLIASWIDDEGKLSDPERLLFPVYTAAEASWCIRNASLNERQDRIHETFVGLLRSHQMDESLGWTQSDLQYGGWGYAINPTRRPTDSTTDGVSTEANISTTLYAIGAIYLANESADPENQAALEHAAHFVHRCQNYSAKPNVSDPRFDDGGFFFSPSDPTGNKAGSSGIDPSGRVRMNSYGSATADGLRALIMCNAPKDEPRIRAARDWIFRRFSATENPGTFARDREVLRNATYYYYCWSMTHALLLTGVNAVEKPEGEINWAEAFAAELMRRQKEDGSWRNHFTDSKEDDPLVATPFAVAALRICRRQLLLSVEDSKTGRPTPKSPGTQ